MSLINCHFTWATCICSLATKMQALSSLRGSKDDRKPVDIDWAASDKPVVISVDGCLRVYDIHLKTSFWSIAEAEFVGETVFPFTITRIC